MKWQCPICWHVHETWNAALYCKHNHWGPPFKPCTWVPPGYEPIQKG